MLFNRSWSIKPSEGGRKPLTTDEHLEVSGETTVQCVMTVYVKIINRSYLSNTAFPQKGKVKVYVCGCVCVLSESHINLLYSCKKRKKNKLLHPDVRAAMTPDPSCHVRETQTEGSVVGTPREKGQKS